MRFFFSIKRKCKYQKPPGQKDGSEELFEEKHKHVFFLIIFNNRYLKFFRICGI